MLVLQSVGRFTSFFNSWVFFLSLSLLPVLSTLVTCTSNAPAHLQATGVAIYPAMLTVARYICSLTRSAALRSVRSLHLLASFTSYLTHFAHFLVGTVEIHKYVFTLKTSFTESLEILVDNTNTPSI